MADEVKKATAITVDRSKIRLGENPRKKLRDIEGLAASIKAKGLIQPIVVNGPIKGLGDEEEYYTVMAGFRRLAALDLLKEKEIQIFAVDKSSVVLSSDKYSLSLIENLERVQMNAHDIAEGLTTLRAKMDQEAGEEGSTSIALLAQAINKSPAYVNQHLALLKMPENIRHAVQDEQISLAAAHTLDRLADPADQAEALGKLIKQEMTLSELKSEITRQETVEMSEQAEEEDEAEDEQPAAQGDESAEETPEVSNSRPGTGEIQLPAADEGTESAVTKVPATDPDDPTPVNKATVKPATKPAKATKPTVKPSKKADSDLVEGIKVAKFKILGERKLRELMLEYAGKAERATSTEKQAEYGFILSGLTLAAGVKS